MLILLIFIEKNKKIINFFYISFINIFEKLTFEKRVNFEINSFWG